MLCAICSNFLQYFKTRKISMVPLCYVMSRASFVQWQWLLSHSISAKRPIYSVFFAGFLCIALWCWLDVWFTRLAPVLLFACSSTQRVCLLMAHHPNTLVFCMEFSLLSEYEMSCVYPASQWFASLGSEIIVDPTACYY